MLKKYVKRRCNEGVNRYKVDIKILSLCIKSLIKKAMFINNRGF